MDPAAISAFVAVGDKGGFRAAAAVLGITSAGVSKAVATGSAARRDARGADAPFGAPADRRRDRPCKAIQAELEEAGQEAAETVALTQGRLVVSTTRTFERLRLMPVIADYVKHHPQVEIEARSNDRPADLVADGVDLAIRVGHLPDSSLIATRVGWTRFVMCGSPDYLAAHGAPARPDDLARHTVVGYIAPDTAIRFTYRFLVNGVARAMFVPSRLTVYDGESLVAAGVRSVGLIMANDYVMEQFINDGTLVPVLRAYELPAIPISAVRLPTRNPLPAARAFTAMLQRRLASP